MMLSFIFTLLQGNNFSFAYTYGLGLKPSVHMRSVVKPQVPECTVAPGLLPPSVDLSNLLPPVGNQGHQNSCTAWAVGYYYKTFEEKKENNWDVSTDVHQFSPAFIYNIVHKDGSTDGTTFEDAFNILKDYGCDTLSYFPYNENDSSTQPTDEQLQLALPFKIASYSPLFWGRLINANAPTTNWVWSGSSLSDTDIDGLKNVIYEGGIFVIAIPVFEDWYSPSFGPSDYIHYVPSNGEETFYGYHAVTIVGYDDSKYGGSFKMVNSWGSNWGDNGFTWITYNWFKQCVEEGWTMTDLSPDFSVTVTKPGDGEVLNGGSVYQVRWNCSDIGGGNCAFIDKTDTSFYNGSSWNNVGMTENSGIFNWNVPNDVYVNCRMKVEVLDETGFVLADNVSGIFSIESSNATIIHFTGSKYNLVSFPFSVSSSDIPNFVQAYSFDWTNFWTTTTTFERGKGYWIKVSQDEDVTLSGTPSSSDVTVSVKGGQGEFNLLGNPFNTPILLSDLNSANGDHILQLYTFDWTNFWTPINPSDFSTKYLEPGRGYWIKLDSNASDTFTFPHP